MHRRTILSRRHKRPILPRNRTHNPSQRRIQRRRNLIHTHLELVKRSPRRTIHLTRQRLSSLKQPPHQHPQILRLRLRPLPQHHQRVTLHRELHAKHPFPKKQFLTHKKMRGPHTLTHPTTTPQPPFKHQIQPVRHRPTPHAPDKQQHPTTRHHVHQTDDIRKPLRHNTRLTPTHPTRSGMCALGASQSSV